MGGFVIRITDNSDPTHHHVVIPEDLDKELRLNEASSNTLPHFPVTIRDLICDTDVIFLRDRSKGDGISKALAILQAGWFMLSIVTRAANGLGLTELEISTLALAFVNFTLYILWWDKAQDAQSQILLHHELKLDANVPETVSSNSFNLTDLITRQLILWNNERKLWRNAKRVPTMWWGKTDHVTDGMPPMTISRHLIPCIVGSIFGAIHCIAWTFSFPSIAEKILWRVCAIAIAIGPTMLCVAWSILMVIVPDKKNVQAIQIIPVAFFLVYLFIRLTLFVLSLIALRAIPYNAYQTCSTSVS
jgi:hypothetical protein